MIEVSIYIYINLRVHIYLDCQRMAIGLSLFGINDLLLCSSKGLGTQLIHIPIHLQKYTYAYRVYISIINTYCNKPTYYVMIIGTRHNVPTTSFFIIVIMPIDVRYIILRLWPDHQTVSQTSNQLKAISPKLKPSI